MAFAYVAETMKDVRHTQRHRGLASAWIAGEGHMQRGRATKRNAGISRMRCLTGASPTRSRSSSAIGAPRSASACSAFRSTTSLAEPNAVADPEMLIVPDPVPQLSLLTFGSVGQPVD